MRMMAQAWVCEYWDCGHIWLNRCVNNAAPVLCAKCHRRRWNKMDWLCVSNIPLTEEEVARGRQIADRELSSRRAG